MRKLWYWMNKRKLLSGPYLLWALGFIILPLLMIIYYGLTSSDGSFTLDNLLAIGEPIHYKALGQSLLIAFGSTCISLLIAYPLAYILSKNQGGKKALSLCCLSFRCGLIFCFGYWPCR